MAAKTERQPSLLDAVDAWLARTPFLETCDFDFIESYRRAALAMLDSDRGMIEGDPAHDEEAKRKEFSRLELVADNLQYLFDEDKYAELLATGKRRLSLAATRAALFINLYREMHILHLPFKLLTLLLDIDELFAMWRYRHALMVHRMIGGKIGTGGSSGYAYLKRTVETHKIFTDFFDLATYLLPRSQIPELPAAVVERLEFSFSGRMAAGTTAAGE